MSLKKYLAAIYAEPDDMALRSVFADWLQQEGDPRGHFIALQLARVDGRATALTMTRELELVEQHGDDWVNPVAKAFSSTKRAFEGGMFAGGHPLARGADLAKMLARVEWPLVRVLEHVDVKVARKVIADHRSRIRALLGVGNAEAIELLRGDQPLPLDEIEIGTIGEIDRHPLAECELLPSLLTLGIRRGGVRLVRFVGEAPVIERIDRFRSDLDERPSALLAALAARSGSLREVELRYHKERDAEWTLVFRRSNAPGPFDRMIARQVSRAKYSGEKIGDSLDTILHAMPTTIDSIAIDLGRPTMRIPPTYQAKLAGELERLNVEHADVPWAVGAKAEATAGVRYVGSVRRATPSAGWSGEVWRLFVDELGQTFDACSVNGRAAKPFGKRDPVQYIAETAAELKTRTLTLVRTGFPERIEISDTWLAFTITTARPPEELVAWFSRVLDTGPIVHAMLRLESEPIERFWPEELPAPAWLVGIEPAVANILDARTAKPLGIRVVPLATESAMLVISARPEGATGERIGEIASRLEQIIDRYFEQRAPWEFAKPAAAFFAPFAKRLGLRGRPTRTSPIRVEWRASDRGGFSVRLVGFLSESFRVELHRIDRDGRLRLLGSAFADESLQATAFATLAKKLPARI